MNDGTTTYNLRTQPTCMLRSLDRPCLAHFLTLKDQHFAGNSFRKALCVCFLAEFPRQRPHYVFVDNRFTTREP